MGSDENPLHIVPDSEMDVRGLLCPEPVMMLHNKVRDMADGDVVRVCATDPSTQRDIPKFCHFLGHELIAEHQMKMVDPTDSLDPPEAPETAKLIRVVQEASMPQTHYGKEGNFQWDFTEKLQPPSSPRWT